MKNRPHLHEQKIHHLRSPSFLFEICLVLEAKSVPLRQKSLRVLLTLQCMWVTKLPTHNVWFEWMPWIPAPLGALCSPLNSQDWVWVSLCTGVKHGQMSLMTATSHSKDRICNNAACRTYTFHAHLLRPERSVLWMAVTSRNVLVTGRKEDSKGDDSHQF